jgi:mono/diheme cytochrome c family protein
VTRETVRAQVLDPLGTMPSFDGFLSDSEIDDLVAYLETL